MPGHSKPLTTSDRETLFALVQKAVEYAVVERAALPVNETEYSEALREHRSTFVTLRLLGELKGCIGNISATQALVCDAAHKAYRAANHDPRMPPVEPVELKDLNIHLSIISPLEKIEFESEEDLLEKITPGVDGIVLDHRSERGVFLPSMWEQLPTAKDFLRHLKIKTGLLPEYWSQNIEAFRFTTETLP